MRNNNSSQRLQRREICEPKNSPGFRFSTQENKGKCKEKPIYENSFRTIELYARDRVSYKTRPMIFEIPANSSTALFASLWDEK